MNRLAACLSLSVATLSLAACTIASPTHATYNESPDELQGASGGAAADAENACCKKADGTAAGQCLAETAVPEDQRDEIGPQECAEGNKCVPAAFVQGTPTKCTLGPFDGVCLDKCFNSYLETFGGLAASDDCGETEACIPCSVLPDNTPGCAAE